MITIFDIIILFLTIFAILMLVRNNWVFNRLNELNRFEDDVHLINNYKAYSEILIRFWIWDIKKFKKGN